MLARHTNTFLNMDIECVKSHCRPYFGKSPLSQQTSAKQEDGKPLMCVSPPVRIFNRKHNTMKKYIFVLAFLFMPFVASAQTNNDALVSALTQLIQLLTQEVMLLEQQLVLAQQATTTPVTLAPITVTIPQAQPEQLDAPVQIAPVVVASDVPVIPAAPTCTLTNEGAQPSGYSGGYSTYLDYTKTVGVAGKITPAVAAGGNVPAASDSGDAVTYTIKGNANTYTLTLTDNFGQTGTCSTTVALPN